MKSLNLNMLNSAMRRGLIAFGAMALVACSSTPPAPKGPSEEELNAKAGLTVTQVGKDVKIAVTNQLLFDSGKFELKGDSAVAIRRTAYLLNRNKALIMVEGHTDNQGSKELNQKLSENRALAVKEALINAGVQTERVGHIGYGLNAPVASNDTPEGRSQNRRTDIVVLDSNIQSLMTPSKPATK